MKRDLNLAQEFRNKCCEVCKSNKNICGHHLLSFKSNPEHDKEYNLIALCVFHHNEIHTKGLTRFVAKYDLQNFMRDRNFEYNPINDKWFLIYGT